MSAYVMLYIRNTKKDAFCEVENWSRSTRGYSMLTGYVNYDQAKKLSNENIYEILNDCRMEIAELEDKNKEFETKIKDLKEILGMDADDKIEDIADFRSYIADNNREIKEFNDLINILNVISRTVRYSENYEIWLAHEWDLAEESAASIAEEYERRAKKGGWPF